MSHPHTTELRVRYGETDRMGVVHHPVYLHWCEIGRTELIRDRLGISYAELEGRGVALAVAEVWVRYHRPARYDEPVRVETSVEGVRSRSVSFTYRVVRGSDGEVLATARTALVAIDRDGKPVRLPQAVRRGLGKEG
ncbi:MAG: acyl-CoA thioesterase [Longimicrobiaceae bacterium]